MMSNKQLPLQQLPPDEFCIYPGVSQYTGNHWLKQAMRIFYGVDYIHAWIGFRLGGIPLVYHSTGFGVHVMSWDSFIKTREIKHMWSIPKEESDYHNFVVEAFTETGKKYSQRQLFGAAIAKILRLKSLPFGVNRDKEHVCSETAGRMVMKYTSAVWGEKSPDLYTPKDFYDTCKHLEIKKEATKIKLVC